MLLERRESLRRWKNVLSIDRVRKMDGRRLDRFYVIVCINAMQLQVQFISHFLPVSSGFHFHTHTFHSLLRVFNANPPCMSRPWRHTSTRRITDITQWQDSVASAAIFCIVVGTRSRQNRSKRWERQNIVVPYIPYGLFQTTGEMCAKFGSDRFRNVDLYKVQTFIFRYKIRDAQ
jgi:hypothetical protein